MWNQYPCLMLVWASAISRCSLKPVADGSNGGQSGVFLLITNLPCKPRKLWLPHLVLLINMGVLYSSCGLLHWQDQKQKKTDLIQQKKICAANVWNVSIMVKTHERTSLQWHILSLSMWFICILLYFLSERYFCSLTKNIHVLNQLTLEHDMLWQGTNKQWDTNI